MKIEFDTDRLKAKINENPALMAAALGTLLAGTAKLMNANTNRKNSKTWAKEVSRRSKKTPR